MRYLQILAFALLTTASTVHAASTQWEVSQGGNGHFYEAFAVPAGISWDDAKNAAEALGGSLATVTTPAEDAFVFDLIKDDPALWNTDHGINGFAVGPWIGGFQLEGSVEPDEGWTWVTGEVWSYTNWAGSQPNDDTSQDSLQYLSDFAVTVIAWNDLNGDSTLTRSYIVETPEPSLSMLLLVVTVFCGMRVIRI